MPLIRTTLAILLALVSLAAPAAAQQRTVVFSGVIDSATDDFGNPVGFPPIPPGSTFSGSFTYDPAAFLSYRTIQLWSVDLPSLASRSVLTVNGITLVSGVRPTWGYQPANPQVQFFSSPSPIWFPGDTSPSDPATGVAILTQPMLRTAGPNLIFSESSFYRVSVVDSYSGSPISFPAPGDIVLRARNQLVLTLDNPGFGSYRIRVIGTITSVGLETTAPVLTLPADIVLFASTPAGSSVTYAVSAVDDTDPQPSVSCSVASGSIFPIGTTTVNCSAADVNGNTRTGSFSITVLDPRGATGPQGPVGPQGPPGPQGPRGEGLFPGSLLLLPAGSPAPSGYDFVGSFALTGKQKKNDLAVDVYRKQ